VCIFGASFGAYAALQGASLAPDLFRCAIGYAGIYDLTVLSSEDAVVTSRLARGYFRRTLGQDERMLERMSPVSHATEIRARVLLAHGEKDWVAPFAHAKKMRSALAAAGNEPEWLVEPIEGHGFYDDGARERMLARVLSFLRESTGTATAK
jgi:dipeptidyl aminopeptidase/acylaminoacyl peptidase